MRPQAATRTAAALPLRQVLLLLLLLLMLRWRPQLMLQHNSLSQHLVKLSRDLVVMWTALMQQPPVGMLPLQSLRGQQHQPQTCGVCLRAMSARCRGMWRLHTSASQPQGRSPFSRQGNCWRRLLLLRRPVVALLVMAVVVMLQQHVNHSLSSCCHLMPTRLRRQTQARRHRQQEQQQEHQMHLSRPRAVLVVVGHWMVAS